jgi:hypothetical protein
VGRYVLLRSCERMEFTFCHPATLNYVAALYQRDENGERFVGLPRDPNLGPPREGEEALLTEAEIETVLNYQGACGRR